MPIPQEQQRDSFPSKPGEQEQKEQDSQQQQQQQQQPQIDPRPHRHPDRRQPDR